MVELFQYKSRRPERDPGVARINGCETPSDRTRRFARFIGGGARINVCGGSPHWTISRKWLIRDAASKRLLCLPAAQWLGDRIANHAVLTGDCGPSTTPSRQQLEEAAAHGQSMGEALGLAAGKASAIRTTSKRRALIEFCARGGFA